ncbi:MAG: hypothetical protein IPJ84_12680 [Bdellovibrionales bacterium]|nr:hypothetical protein [Bdellovibrionales bacterium]
MIRFLAGLFLLTTTFAQAQVCEDLFKRDLVDTRTLVSQAMLERQSLPLEKRLAQTLAAVGQNGSPRLVAKTLIEKGELVLGLAGADGVTVLAEYRLNAQKNPPVFRLAKLSSLDAKGNEVEISKTPFDSTTGELRYELETRADISAIRTQLMLSLEADVTAAIRASAPWLTLVEPHEFRALVGEASISIGKLKMVGQKRRLMVFFNDRIGRKAFDFLILGAVVSGTNYLTSYLSNDERDAVTAVREDVVTSMLGEVSKLEAKTGELPARERDWLFVQITEATKKKAFENKKGSNVKAASVQMLSNLQTDLVYWLRDRQTGRIYLAGVTGIDLNHADAGIGLKTQVMIEILPIQTPKTFAAINAQFGPSDRSK